MECFNWLCQSLHTIFFHHVLKLREKSQKNNFGNWKNNKIKNKLKIHKSFHLFSTLRVCIKFQVFLWKTKMSFRIHLLVALGVVSIRRKKFFWKRVCRGMDCWGSWILVRSVFPNREWSTVCRSFGLTSRNGQSKTKNIATEIRSGDRIVWRSLRPH